MEHRKRFGAGTSITGAPYEILISHISMESDFLCTLVNFKGQIVQMGYPD